jgi:hypothetical protein
MSSSRNLPLRNMPFGRWLTLSMALPVASLVMHWQATALRERRSRMYHEKVIWQAEPCA